MSWELEYKNKLRTRRGRAVPSVTSSSDSRHSALGVCARGFQQRVSSAQVLHARHGDPACQWSYKSEECFWPNTTRVNRIKEFAFLPDCRSDNAPKFCPVAVWMSCKLGRNAEATDSLANPNQHKYRLT